MPESESQNQPFDIQGFAIAVQALFQSSLEQQQNLMQKMLSQVISLASKVNELEEAQAAKRSPAKK